MGTWGADAFANDDAMDWIGDLRSVTDSSVLVGAFEPALAESKFIEAPAGSVALAAAEVVAALRGHPHVGLPPEVIDWVSTFGRFNEVRLIDMARRVVAVVADDQDRSELRQLWNEAAPGDRAEWEQEMALLRGRLA